jgi:hypothetical protein
MAFPCLELRSKQGYHGAVLALSACRPPISDSKQDIQAFFDRKRESFHCRVKSVMRSETSTAPFFRAPLASVRPDARDPHVATVPMVELSDLHWDRSASGSRFERPTLWAFTSRDSIVAGELPGTGPRASHPVRVCILREDNDRRVFDRLILEAGPPPRR